MSAIVDPKCRCGHARSIHDAIGRAPLLMDERYIKRARCLLKRCGCKGYVDANFSESEEPHGD